MALTSTLPVFETFVPGAPIPPGLDVLTPQLRDDFIHARDRAAQNASSIYRDLVPKGMKLELAFARAGGLLIVGTDPTGSGRVIPGYADQRALELLVEEGFTPLEAISIGTLNGATFLGRERRIGTIAAGKQADLVIVAGDPATNIADLRHVETRRDAAVNRRLWEMRPESNVTESWPGRRREHKPLAERVAQRTSSLTRISTSGKA